MSLTDCFNRVKGVDPGDQAEIESLVKNGASETEAVEQVMRGINMELNEIVDEVGDQAPVAALKAGPKRSDLPPTNIEQARANLKDAKASVIAAEDQIVSDIQNGLERDPQLEDYERAKAKRWVKDATRQLNKLKKREKPELDMTEAEAMLDAALARYDDGMFEAREEVAEATARIKAAGVEGVEIDTAELIIAQENLKRVKELRSKAIDRARKQVARAEERASGKVTVDGDKGDGGSSGGGDGSSGGGADGTTDGESPNYDMPEYDWHDNIMRKVQDAILPLHQLQKNIVKFTGRKLSEWENVTLAHEGMVPQAMNDADKLEDNYVKPLAKYLGKHKAKIDIDGLGLYLIAKAAGARNNKINERRAGEEEYYDAGSGMSNEESAAIIAKAKADGVDGLLEEAAEFVYGILEIQRGMMESGLASHKEVNYWREQQPFYVPLKTKHVDGKDRAAISGKGFDVRGKESFKAMGRRTMADNPVYFAVQDTIATIMRYHQNEVGNVFYNLVQNNPHADFKIFSDANPDHDPATGNAMYGKLYSKDKYFATKVDGVQFYIRVDGEQNAPILKALNGMTPEHTNTVMRASGRIVRWMSAMNTSFNPEFVVSNIFRDVQTAVFNVMSEQELEDGRAKGGKLVKKMLKGVVPSGKVITATQMGVKYEPGHKDYQLQVDYDLFKEMGGTMGWVNIQNMEDTVSSMSSAIRDADGSKGAAARKFAKGGIKLVNNINSAVENSTRLSVFSAAIHARGADGQPMFTPKEAASLSRNLTVNFNRKGEWGQWMSQLYMFANASIQGSAVVFRAMGVQKSAPGKKIPYTIGRIEGADGEKHLSSSQKLALSVVAGGAAWGAVMRQFGGEDDDGVAWWDKVPDYERERNLILMNPLSEKEGDYLKIPLPYGFNIFYVLGDQIDATLSGGRAPLAAAMHVAGAFAGSFSPVGFSTTDDPISKGLLKNFTPSALRPLAELTADENFFGVEIARDNYPGGLQKPDSQLGKRRTSQGYKSIAQFLNQVGLPIEGLEGGTDYISGPLDVNPDVLKHLVDGYMGGAWQFAARTAGMVEKTVTGQGLEAREVPFVRKFAGDIKPYDDFKLFKARRVKIEQVVAESKTLKGIPHQKYRKRFATEFKLAGFAKATEKRLKKMRKAARAAEFNDNLEAAVRRERVKTIEAQQKAAIDRFNKRWLELENE